MPTENPLASPYNAQVEENIRLRQELSMLKLRTRPLDNLIEDNENLRNTNATLMHQNADLTRENELLKSQISDLKSVPSVKSVDKKVFNAAGNNATAKTTEKEPMPTNPEPETIPVDQPDTPIPADCADTELPPPGAAGPKTGFLGRAANRIGEAIDDVQQTIGLQANEPQGACIGRPVEFQPKPIDEVMGEVIAAVSKVQEAQGRALTVKVQIHLHGFLGYGGTLEFTL